MKNKTFYAAMRALLPLLKLFFVLFSKQSNGFAFVVLKPRLPVDLHPWLRLENSRILLNEEWMRLRYGSRK